MTARKPRDAKWYKRLLDLNALMLMGATAGERESARTKLLELLTVNKLTLHDLDDLIAMAKRVIAGEVKPENMAEPSKPGDDAPDLDIVEQIEGLLDVYLDLKAHERTVVALWVLHCYIFQQFTESPRLLFLSAMEGEGKTTVLNILHKMVFPSIKCATLTAAALRNIANRDDHPTMLLDEGRNLDIQNNPIMRAILHSGHERGGTAILAASGGTNITYSTFMPLAITSIKELPSYELMSRCIVIRLKRSRRKDIKKFLEEDGTYDPIYLNVRQWASWAQHNLDLRNVDPDLPKLMNRRADNWRPIIAIADALRVGVKARWAMRQFDHKYTVAPAARMLYDLREIFGDSHAMHSKDIVTELHKIETSPWGEWRGEHGTQPARPITPIGVAAVLHPLHPPIRPHTIEIDGVSLKGYHRADFADAWATYCEDAADAEPAPPLQPEAITEREPWDTDEPLPGRSDR
jgi:hypothetical protein